MSNTSSFRLRFDYYAMELTSVYTALNYSASLERVIFDLSVFYFYMTPWYTFVLLLGTNLDRMEQVMSVGLEGMRGHRVFVKAKTEMRKKHALLLNTMKESKERILSEKTDSVFYLVSHGSPIHKASKRVLRSILSPLTIMMDFFSALISNSLFF